MLLTDHDHGVLLREKCLIQLDNNISSPNGLQCVLCDWLLDLVT